MKFRVTELGAFFYQFILGVPNTSSEKNQGGLHKAQ
jgi:hypothetical protein